MNNPITNMARRARLARLRSNTRTHGMRLDLRLYVYPDGSTWLIQPSQHGDEGFGTDSTERSAERFADLIREVQALHPENAENAA